MAQSHVNLLVSVCDSRSEGRCVGGWCCPMNCHISPVPLCDLPFSVWLGLERACFHTLFTNSGIYSSGYESQELKETTSVIQSYSSLTAASIWLTFLSLFAINASGIIRLFKHPLIFNSLTTFTTHHARDIVSHLWLQRLNMNVGSFTVGFKTPDIGIICLYMLNRRLM